MTAKRLVVLVGTILFVVAAIAYHQELVLAWPQWALLAFACWLGSSLVS